ncbi:DNA polymerase III subunit delta' [Persephonella atlantica]|uniref:DNA polymerase III subunit delta n=1 Tax=Persephonella atlantica TaxID=2699429 RepID=A0ABS1GK52_9AQUI|nr:DNA polymerase III subunit delta' [Persephonella atlantica]MBK3333324.1 DNA polymerase III subunit delta' [Persephonella atlantica]
MKLIGHQDSLRLIRRFLDKKYSSYSFLFEGKDCIGKKLAALLTAKAFLCEKDYSFGCNECEDCRLANNTILNAYERKELNPHPDIMIVSPEREIKIDQIRQVIQFLKLKRKKAVIIEKAEKMNLEASNALLKTLEEPPDDSLLILTTSSQDMLLPTIVSRCKKVRFRPLKKEELQQILTLKNVEEKNYQILLALSDGSMCIPEAVIRDEKLLKYARDLYNLLYIDELHPEGIITLGEIFEKLKSEEIEIITNIVEKIMYKKTVKGEVNPDFYDRFIKESQEFKKSINRGVKKKLALEGMYFNLKT